MPRIKLFKLSISLDSSIYELDFSVQVKDRKKVETYLIHVPLNDFQSNIDAIFDVVKKEIKTRILKTMKE